MRPRQGIILVALATLVASSGCDEVAVRDGATTQPLVFEPAAMRMLLSADGIEAMYEVARPDGFDLRHDALALPTDEGELSIGPLDQSIPVSTRAAESSDDVLTLTTVLRDVEVALPLRYRRGVDVHICRFRIRGEQVTIDAELALIRRDGQEDFAVLEEPAVKTNALTVEPVGDCQLPLDTLLPDREQELADYVRAGFSVSSSQALRTSPLDLLGLVLRRVEMSRLSAFGNRRGQLVFDGRLSRDDALALSPRGLEASVELAADARRADCAPPAELTIPGSAGAAEVADDELNRYDAAVGLSISMAMLQRLAQTATRAGFVCRGLEPADEAQERIASDDARLGDIGLDAAPLGPWVRTTLSPGALPQMVTRPSRGDLLLNWDDLSFEVYGEVLSVPSRLLAVESDLRISLRPRPSSAGAIAFDVESLEVDRATIDSGWLATPPDEEALRAWTRRMLLLILADRLEFPLPLDPTSPLRVVGTDLRADDLVVYLDFDR